MSSRTASRLPSRLYGRRYGARPHAKSDYFHLAVKILNSYRSFASLSEQNTSVFPSGDHSGKLVNPPKFVTCSSPDPSTFIMNSSNLRLSHSCLFDENRIFLPSG